MGALLLIVAVAAGTLNVYYRPTIESLPACRLGGADGES
jgi:hypothetical protein